MVNNSSCRTSSGELEISSIRYCIYSCFNIYSYVIESKEMNFNHTYAQRPTHDFLYYDKQETALQSFREALKKELCHNKREKKGSLGLSENTVLAPTNQRLNYSREGMSCPKGCCACWVPLDKSLWCLNINGNYSKL